MPIYEFRCATCGERFEALLSPTERAKARCPSCGAVRIERQLSTFAVGKTSVAGSAPGPCGSHCACHARDA